MLFTTNDSTVTKGECTATCLARTVSPEGGAEIVTWELKYPRYIHCFDEETEILAVVGNDAPRFMSFEKAEALGAMVAQYDNGKISFVEPTEWIKKDGCHRMVAYEGRKLSMCVTDGHRVLVNKRTTGNSFVPETWRAEDLLGDYVTFRLPQSGYFQENQRFSKEELALMAWFACDGTKQNARVCFHFRKKRKVDAVVRLLTSLAISFVKRAYEDSTCIWFDAPAWVDDCYTDSQEKKLPEYGMFMDNEAYAFVKQALLESDGCVANQEFNTTSKVLAEQVQVLAHLHGDAMNLRFYGRDNGRMYKSSFKDTNYISFRRDKDKFEEIEVRGCVYCVSVPSSYVVVRRKGFVFVSGNCELMTHRMFSRSASSSRATPLKVTLDEVRNNPAGFSKVGRNQPGMVAGNELPEIGREAFLAEWRQLGAEVAKSVESMSERYGVHKQLLNRALEPWLYMHTIVTATELDNFFHLRLARDAQPEMQDLAQAMLISMLNQPKVEATWHLPYREKFNGIISRNVAACARVCVTRHDGTEPSILQDETLAGQLLEGGHLTPFEHVAKAGEPDQMYANFKGWKSYRWMLENNQDIGLKSNG